ncbi:MAG: reverse transcriptase N-terminal domain-containing protein [Trichodesmium sp. St16_bin4-tuft]|nr:reverse transcriptase N-terminal domain-containing protein [Trichodesmium sp. MAG_R01]MDE5068048.1 reverse transcriptase N-terminal domain-containing protein [Trichodesmium sp. St4_bin8_1]MDE5073446.1 reverse transcriptase N-terminal domain-containing protein [Trichodesmium sp. St5_bin8]MDE5090861.1 reverse transcriptase N-terminal domain-containing protein [Trichodesmium sp. St18_bin3_1_1]MDE5099409.1 reverse transcriptase N-terminal domain-containing protein [Trichodesmium sp. St16_bin4-tu
MGNYQKLLSKSYYTRLLTVRGVTQDNQCKKTAGINGIKNLPPMERFNLVDILKTRFLQASPTRRVTDSKTRMRRKTPIRHEPIPLIICD